MVGFTGSATGLVRFFINYRKTINMKDTKSQVQAQHPKTNDNRNRPENKDNLDSRDQEEQDDKGSHTTHNKREVKSEKPGKH